MEWAIARGVIDGMTSTTLQPQGTATRAHCATIFMRYDALGLEGGALFAEGRLIGFTIGEVISSDTFDVHFEKAYASIPGAYPMVCREFARQIMADHPNIVYLNREDDMGSEGLRRAKESYQPTVLLEKYVADWKEN